MERIYAITDESGAFGWDLDNQNVSTHFIITAVLVRESQLEYVKEQLEVIRKKHFQTGEMKSSKIGHNHERRKRILAELLSLPFNLLPVIIDKVGLLDMPGLRYKQSFYKFMNNIVHKELRQAFGKLTIVADEIGGSDYMKSFSEYVKKREDIPTLLGEADFFFQNSENNVLVQLADVMSGTFSYVYDLHKKSVDTLYFKQQLEKKITRIELYPKTYATYTVGSSALAKEYDKDIAEICFKSVVDFIEKHRGIEDVDTQAQIVVLKYLLFRFMNNDLRKYISTKELKQQLVNMKIGEISTQKFRMQIIAKLRDEGVVIASSSKGYKIPSKQSELYDFINHGTSIIMPMLGRLRTCRDLIKLGTINKLDLFDNTEYSSLKKYFDDI